MSLQLRNILNIKRLAIKNIKESSVDFFIEGCYRYYSTTYHTPLQSAYELPEEEVCKIYFEDTLKEASADDLEDIIKHLDNALKMKLSPDEESGVDTGISDEDWIAQQSLELKREEMAKNGKSQEDSHEDVIKKTHDIIENLTRSLKGFEKE